jgi:cyclophilin family peptidyl-prolyl cis-trans isomerase
LYFLTIVGFMAQDGDPTGTGTGGPGYHIPDEFHPHLRHNRPGVLSMANRGPNTGGSQFFVTHVATPWLDDRHAVFGEVVEGMEVVEAIRERDPQSDREPGDRLERVEIEETPARVSAADGCAFTASGQVQRLPCPQTAYVQEVI